MDNENKVEGQEEMQKEMPAHETPSEETPMDNKEAPTKKDGSSGPLVGIIIIVIILILGGLYFWGQKASEATIEALETQSLSDEVGDIEADLDASGLGNLDREIGDIEAELGL